MIRVGVTGLRDLSVFDIAELKKSISKVLEAIKQRNDKIIMLNSIASGADQLCAQVGLSMDCDLVCPLPFEEYRNDFCAGDQKLYDLILEKASDSFVVSDDTNIDAAYLAAGKYIVEHCDEMLAIWDGRPQTSICGTEAVIEYAKLLGKQVTIFQ